MGVSTLVNKSQLLFHHPLVYRTMATHQLLFENCNLVRLDS